MAARPPPRAMRIAISGARTAARARSKPAMLTQPIKRTTPTAPHGSRAAGAGPPCAPAATAPAASGPWTPARTRTDFKSSVANRGDLAVGITPGRAGPQTRGDRVVLATALTPGRRPKRRPDIDHRIRAEPGRHDADNRVRLTTQHHRPSRSRGIAAERTGPQRVAQNRDRRTVDAILVGGELASQRGRHAEHAEKTVGHPLLLDKGRLSTGDEIDPAAAAFACRHINQ